MNTAGSYHARFRRLLNHAFSEKGLQEQQGLITKYIDLFIGKLDHFAQTQETVNITDWYVNPESKLHGYLYECLTEAFKTNSRLVMVGFDVISDLGWSEPFNCVEKGEVHPWVRLKAILNVFSALRVELF